ncbi:MAG TPA: sigma-70 family RNA polymerase sigma factor [Thauera aminoaromatica]|nr:sigma-70 family RNA polymerase sigma factor [Thauera aminoaromatica]
MTTTALQQRQHELWQLRRDSSAMKELIETMQGGIIDLARRFSVMSDMDRHDLESECYMAFLHWVERWNPDGGKPLFGFLYERMAWRLMRYTKEQRHTIRLPESTFHKKHVVVKCRSMDARIKSDDGERQNLSDVLFDAEVEPADVTCQRAFNVAKVREILATMSEREQWILQERADDRTLEEIGKDLGLCRERVRQIEEQALDKLRRRYRKACAITSASMQRC